METKLPDTKPSVKERFGHAAISIGYAGVLAAGIGMATEGVLEQKFPIRVDNAQPSEALSDAFKALVTGSAVLGGAAILKRGVDHVRYQKSDRLKAIHKTAHASDRRRYFGSVAGLSVVSAGMTGMFIDIADGVESMGTDVVEGISAIATQAGGDSDEPIYVLSNTPRPELANNAVFNPAAATDIMANAPESGVTIVPLRYGWHSAQREGHEDQKIQALAVGLPEEITGLPPASEDCEDVSVIAAKEMGVEVGKSFTMEGLTVTVREVLPSGQGAGANLVSTIMNNEDFARCLDTNEDQPMSVLLAQGEKEEVEQLLEESNVSAENLDKRVFVVPMEDFEENTRETGGNNVHPFILPTILLGWGFAAGSRINKAKDVLANSRGDYTMYRATNVSKSAIAKLEYEKSDAEAMQSATVAMPFVVLFDYAVNTGTPGAALGPSIVTGLAVFGSTAAMHRISKRRALRSEFKKMNVAKGYEV